MSETTTEAGRELDALIAERVMGYSVKWLPTALAPEGAPHYANSEEGSGWLVCRLYTLDMSATWRVVEEMGKRGFHARIQTPFIPGDEFHAGFTPHGSSGWNGRPDFAASADSAPLAICRAALLAVGGPP